jgi:hypothetical protein
VFCRRHVFAFRCLLTICFSSIIHQSMRNSTRFAAVCLELQGGEDSSRKAFFHGG